MIKLGSCFSGIGGVELGFRQAAQEIGTNLEISFQVEIDKFCNKVLAAHFPDTKKYLDVRECGAHNLPKVDILVGGFPCQNLSIAGNRSGLAGDSEKAARDGARRLVHLKDIREVYPNCMHKYSWNEEAFFEPPPDYDRLLESFGYRNVIQVNDEDYEGDSRILFKDGSRYGILIFGWGSCSGCDALLGCNSYEELDELRQQLYDSIIWFDSPKEVLDYVENKEWHLEWYGHREETKEFVRRIKNRFIGM